MNVGRAWLTQGAAKGAGAVQELFRRQRLSNMSAPLKLLPMFNRPEAIIPALREACAPLMYHSLIILS